MSSGLSLSEGSVSTVLMPRQMPQKKRAWELLFCLTYSNEPKNWTQASFCLALPWTVFQRGLMLFYVLGGVEHCYLFVLYIAKWTMGMISWKVTILKGGGCVSSWHSGSCCYLSVLVKPTCLAALQNKHLMFGVGRLVFVGPTLCKIRAGIHGAWLNLTWKTTKRYCWCCEAFPYEGISSGSCGILLEIVCSTCPEGSALECLAEWCLWHLAFIAAEEWFMVAHQDLRLSY